MKKTRMIPLAAALLSSAFLNAAEPKFPKCENVSAILNTLQQKGADTLVKLKRQQNSWIATDTKNKQFSIRCIPSGSGNKAVEKSKKKKTNKLSLLQMAAIVKKKSSGKIESIEFKNNYFMVILKEDGVEIDQYYSPEGKLKSWVIVD